LKSAFFLMACLFLFSLLYQPTVLNAVPAHHHINDNSHVANATDSSALNEDPSLAPEESQIVALVNGTEAYDYASELEDIGLHHSLSDYSFRIAGSSGANETAKYIMKQFQSFGLETHNESFQFTNWNLPTEPMLTIDGDGDPGTTGDQTEIHSFLPTHYSWPTPQGGIFRDLVVLPLPAAASVNEIGLNPINTEVWNTIDTTGKILLIGREATWNWDWHTTYRNKLVSQPPAAIILTWWYDWMSFTPMMYGSAGGLPITVWGPYYWDLEIPVGGIDYAHGLWVRNKENTENIFALFKIESVIGQGPHYNVIGKLTGYGEPSKLVIISGHYDTVATAGFCDNGAGTAGVIEAAKVVTGAVKNGLYRPKYSLLFIAFAGEEMGLVGSVYYIKQHITDMSNVVAVINLDCIGSDDFCVSETVAAGGLDLDQLVLDATADLGVTAALTEPGGSDQEAFQDPSSANGMVQYWWGIDPGISDATPVQSSALLISEPLTYREKWSSGAPGWIHTSYDNSSSTVTLNWVEIDDLQNHIKIAVLSTLRVSPMVVRDVAITSVACSKTIVGQGYTMQIYVTVRNLGDYTENFNVTAFANTTMFERKETSLAEKTQTSLTFTWNTTDFAKGNWTISASADPVLGEIVTANNIHTNGEVIVTTAGDVNADGVVNILDAAGVSAHWYPGPPIGPLGFDPNFDIENDGVIGILDAAKVSAYWTGPPKGPLDP